MDLASADDADDLVPRLLEIERTLNLRGMILRHPDRVLVAEEVRRVQHRHMECVALDPLAAVHEAPQLPERAVDPYAERILHRVNRAHLIRNRTNPADARGNVRGLVVHPAAEKGLEETGRLENLEMNLLDSIAPYFDVERPLAFDPRQRVDDDRAGATHG